MFISLRKCNFSVPPRIVSFSFGDEPLEAGSHATLQCSVDQGDIPLTISWIFHGKELSSQMGIETTRIGKRVNVLTIESIAPFHAGDYVCVATNAAGSTNYTTELVIMGTCVIFRKQFQLSLPCNNSAEYIII